MTAQDFISILSLDLQETNAKEKFWDNPQLFVKLQRAYKKVQDDLPYFVSKEKLLIEEGNTKAYLKHEAIEDVSFKIDSMPYKYCENDNLYSYEDSYYYTMDRKELTLARVPEKEMQGVIAYKYAKQLETLTDEIALPSKYEEALRLLTLSYVFEKSKGNSKERDLSVHYLKRYDRETMIIRRKRKRAKNVRSIYQKV